MGQMTQQFPIPSPPFEAGPISSVWPAIVIYFLPALAIFYVVLSCLWLVPDTLFGMYGNHDGQWASWNVRGILEWGRFLDFSPFSPLVGTGSLFLPNLPWLNPGALALAIPAPLAVWHLLSMLVYLAELSDRSTCFIAISNFRGHNRSSQPFSTSGSLSFPAGRRRSHGLRSRP
jgi:hypothetical protein